MHGGADDTLNHHAYFYRFIDEDLIFILFANTTEEKTIETLKGCLGLLFP